MFAQIVGKFPLWANECIQGAVFLHNTSKVCSAVTDLTKFLLTFWQTNLHFSLRCFSAISGIILYNLLPYVKYSALENNTEPRTSDLLWPRNVAMWSIIIWINEFQLALLNYRQTGLYPTPLHYSPHFLPAIYIASHNSRDASRDRIAPTAVSTQCSTSANRGRRPARLSLQPWLWIT